jgi:hypothetical protein
MKLNFIYEILVPNNVSWVWEYSPKLKKLNATNQNHLF